MKKRKAMLIAIIIISSFILPISKISAQTVNITYLKDGVYIETYIEEINSPILTRSGLIKTSKKNSELQISIWCDTMVRHGDWNI